MIEYEPDKWEHEEVSARVPHSIIFAVFALLDIDPATIMTGSLSIEYEDSNYSVVSYTRLKR